jgi:hypothetical protein
MSEEKTTELIAEAHEAKLLKRLLAEKLSAYNGIRHDELKSICAMFGIAEKEWVPNENIL